MPTSDYTPTVEEVAALLRARTKDNLGQEVGTFNESTRPTGAEVESMIANAVTDLASALGADLPDAADEDQAGDVDAYRNYAKRLAILSTAMDIELSYFPEQVESGRSAYEAYERRYNTGLERLTEAVGEAHGGREGSAVGEGASLPSFHFPEDKGGLIGWGTQW